MPSDVLIVGSGPSGCVLAARLSEDPARTVTLLEAGSSGALASGVLASPELLDARSLAGAAPGSAYSRRFLGQLTPAVAIAVPRGWVLGGSSAVNAAYFVRGTPEDFDAWADAGNDRWSFEQVLPAFRRLETDDDAVTGRLPAVTTGVDGSAQLHGTEGPVPVSRAGSRTVGPLPDAFVAAATALGFPEEPDKNAGGAPGAGPIPRNVRGGQRVSAAAAYLLPVLGRPNLDIRCDHEVRRLVFDGVRAVGVEVVSGGKLQRLYADEIIVCAGGIGSPWLLLRSGVGPAEQLRACGVEVVQHLPGVGRNLADHPHLAVPYEPVTPPLMPPHGSPIPVALNLSSPDALRPGDLEIILRTSSFAELDLAEPDPTAPSLSIGVNLQQPSSRGELRLRSADPAVPPGIAYRYLEHPSDLRRLRVGVETVVELLATAPLRALLRGPAYLPDGVLDHAATFAAWARSSLTTNIHASGTCRMGDVSDPASVVDQTGRVHGVDGLRVVDTSIMPTITSRGPNATATMIGERVAELLGLVHPAGSPSASAPSP